MLRREFVQRKLQLITDDLGHLAQYRETSHGELLEDFVTQAAVERLLERIVMRAIDVNQHLLAELGTGLEPQTTRLTYRDSFKMLADIGVYPAEFADEIALSAGLRNILVHDYNDANRQLVHASIRTCLDQYPHYVDYVLAFLDRQTPEQSD